MQALFIAVIRDEAALGRPVSAATLHRIHATLCAALNGAVRAGLNELFFECFQQVLQPHAGELLAIRPEAGPATRAPE